MKLALTLLVAAGIATSWTPAVASPPEMQWPIKRLALSSLRPQTGDIVVTLRASGSGWVVDGDASIQQPDVEQIWFRRINESGHIVVLAKVLNPAPETERSICTFGLMANRASKERAVGGYTECTSAFFKCDVTLADAFLFVPSLITATRSCPMKLDKDKVQAALESANVATWLVAYKEDQKLQAYRRDFGSIRTSQDADRFIQLHQQFDPEGLVEKPGSKRTHC